VARNALEKAELKVDSRDVVAAPQQNGIVVDQAPNPGTLLPPGGVVNIAVGRLTIVPNVLGIDATRAGDVLNNAGLRVTLVRDHRFGVVTNLVQDQNPRGGVAVPFGTTVAITIFVP
jgi:beta-lactam-binding protein with PASTA domain